MTYQQNNLYLIEFGYKFMVDEFSYFKTCIEKGELNVYGLEFKFIFIKMCNTLIREGGSIISIWNWPDQLDCFPNLIN